MSAKYLLDTGCLFFLAARNPKMLNLYKDKFAGNIQLSSIIQAEAICGYKYIGANKKLGLIEEYIHRYPSHSVDELTARTASDIWVIAKKKGLIDKGIPVDYYIAATCLINNLTLVTFNSKHFDFIPELKLIALNYGEYIKAQASKK